MQPMLRNVERYRGDGVRVYEKYKVKGSVQVWEGHKHSRNISHERVDQWRDPM